MKNGKEKGVWIIYAGVLVILFLLSSTDLIIKEQKNEIYAISVIVEDSKDDNYVNFKKGMDQAAMEMHADVSFISLYDAGDSEQQLDLIIREIQDGMQALIISPADVDVLAAAMHDNRIRGPVVLLNSDLIDDKIAATISPDYYVMGQQLATAVASENNTDTPIYLFTKKQPEGVSRRFYDGLLSVLDQAGFQTALVQSQELGSFGRKIESIIYPGGRQPALIALDTESLLEMAEALSERGTAEYMSGLYGRGSNISVLSYLDKGLITGVCVVDEYGIGYQSVKAAIDVIEKHSTQGIPTPESYYIKKEDITRPEYVKMLYPIE